MYALLGNQKGRIRVALNFANLPTWKANQVYCMIQNNDRVEVVVAENKAEVPMIYGLPVDFQDGVIVRVFDFGGNSRTLEHTQCPYCCGSARLEILHAQFKCIQCQTEFTADDLKNLAIRDRDWAIQDAHQRLDQQIREMYRELSKSRND